MVVKDVAFFQSDHKYLTSIRNPLHNLVLTEVFFSDLLLETPCMWIWWTTYSLLFFPGNTIWDKWLLSKQTINRFDHSIYQYYQLPRFIWYSINLYITGRIFTFLSLVYQFINVFFSFAGNMQQRDSDSTATLWLTIKISKTEYIQ